MSPLAQLQQKFNRNVSRILAGQKLHLGKVAVALSGGVDSISLTHLLLNYKSTTPDVKEITAITINHNYRKETATEIEQLRKNLSHIHDLKLQVIDIDWALLNFDREKLHLVGNFESLARTQRYRIFEDYCRAHGIESLFLGHTLDDQIETFAQRLLKQSTLFGLKCMNELTCLHGDATESPVKLVRPLLDVPKSQLYQFCESQHLQWFEDQTNKDLSLTSRNLIRSRLTARDRSEIGNLIKEVRSFVETVLETKIRNLARQGHNLFRVDEQFQVISLKIPKTEVSNPDNRILISRFLWCLNYQISHLPKYHYTYGRHTSELLYDRIKNTSDTDKFTYLGSSWQIEALDSYLEVKISREVPRSNCIHKIDLSRRAEFLFDNRFIVSIAPNGHSTVESDQKYHLRLFVKDDFNSLSKNWRELLKKHNIQPSNLLTLPVVTRDGKIVAFPTLKLKEEIPFEVEMSLKRNIYIE